MAAQYFQLTPYEMVGEFHEAFGHPTNSIYNISYCELNFNAMTFRYNLNAEELAELICAHRKLYEFIELYKNCEIDFGDVLKKNIMIEYTEVIDACADLTYVLNGQLHYIGYNPDIQHSCDVIKCIHPTESNMRKFNIHDVQTKMYSEMIIKELELSLSMMNNHITETSIVVMLTCHMLNLIRSLSTAMGVDILRAVEIVHNSNMTKLCYSEEESHATVVKYNHMYAETQNPKFQYPTIKVVKPNEIWMVCNMEPLKGPECAKVLKSINYKDPDFSTTIENSVDLF